MEVCAVIVSDHCLGSRKYQEGGFCLHELKVALEKLHASVKLLFVRQFGTFNNPRIEEFPDIDKVTGCIVKAFRRNPDVDITWPMHNGAARGTVLYTLVRQTDC
ncbi:uncharacterized protein EURHEDRAFT_412542 [Aspergillus ruber CBS 135680]|uniref:Uncharacterized protein n=1 Tax=Aspergillus ruber (strain CBS 135680) TaxID=1388766 RepID=A0A017SE34_ASPRC|nr:uncharacterized protein EURHEDRAFT_412542 [Aspergillus ruber CBS 135680]EYE95212.1 hypothetical protein EURHEDRAFT_412542 [Aspergillus ruber CBS 135680]